KIGSTRSCGTECIIQDTCEAIWEVLQYRVLFQPSQENWMKIADDFFERWNFPHCIGAIDGKHVVIQAPPHAGSTFYNYKGQHSIVLIAIVSASYKFLMVDIGAQGRHNDGGIFKGSIMGQRFENKQMDLPSPCPLSNFCDIPIPYMLQQILEMYFVNILYKKALYLGKKYLII
ncbi:nuclease harbi1, partial [Lasius niger]